MVSPSALRDVEGDDDATLAVKGLAGRADEADAATLQRHGLARDKRVLHALLEQSVSQG